MGAAVLAVTQTDQSQQPLAATNVSSVLASSSAEPPTQVSRDAEIAPLTTEAEVDAEIKGEMFANKALAVYADSTDKSPELATVAAGDTVDVTGIEKDGWTQIIHNGAPRWVAAKGLSKEEPLGSAPCARFNEGGLQPNGIKVMRAICAKYPSISRIGTIAGRGEHATGHALDIMVSSDLGTDISNFLMENRSELGVEYIIWRQRIWRPATSNSWRGMSDRGGATANHMDHVHVTVYGGSRRP